MSNLGPSRSSTQNEVNVTASVDNGEVSAKVNGKSYAIGAQGPITVLFPSGDTSGATDYANVAPYLVATVAADLWLQPGDWYFNDTLVRMPRRNAANTDWEYNTLLSRSTDATMPSFFGTGSELTRLHFTDVTKPGIYFWRPPSGIAGGPTLNVRSRASSSDTSHDPLTIGDFSFGGFTIIGACSPYYTASNHYSLDNEARWPNHIGIAIWGSNNNIQMDDVSIQYFGTGLVLHDTTGLKASDYAITNCDIGLAMGIQTDGCLFMNGWIEICRVGVSMVWDGWQTGTGTSATYAGIGRESNGTYLGSTSYDNDVSNFISCFFGQCAFSSISGHANPANTTAMDNYSIAFNSCYWESNASILYYFKNQQIGMYEFNSCTFRGLTSSNTVGAYTAGNLDAQTGPIQEILRHYLPGRLGNSQNTTNKNFGQFFGYGNISGNIAFRNCRFDASVYPVVLAKAGVSVRWDNNYSFFNGAVTYPAIAAQIAAESGAGYTGCRVLTADIQWNTTDNFNTPGEFFIKDGFAAEAGGVPTGITTAVALPAASATYRGQNRTIIGAAGAADVTYQCMKSAADTYSWKAVATG